MRAPRRRLIAALVSTLAVLPMTSCGAPSAPNVGFLASATAQSPREDGDATTVLPPDMAGANLLVAVAMGDGPDNPPNQHSVLADSGRHQWTLRDHHVVFGSIIDVYTAPGTGTEAGTTVSSELTVKHGDEGHALTVIAYRSGRFDSTTDLNGHFTVPQLRRSVPPGEDVLTVYGDGRQNTPITPVPGFRPVNVMPTDGGPAGDRDLYQLSQLDPPGSWRGGPMLTGNLAPPGSGFWGLVDVDIAPA